jgi:hypothetical protein
MRLVLYAARRKPRSPVSSEKHYDQSNIGQLQPLQELAFGKTAYLMEQLIARLPHRRAALLMTVILNVVQSVIRQVKDLETELIESFGPKSSAETHRDRYDSQIRYVCACGVCESTRERACDAPP